MEQLNQDPRGKTKLISPKPSFFNPETDVEPVGDVRGSTRLITPEEKSAKFANSALGLAVNIVKEIPRATVDITTPPISLVKKPKTQILPTIKEAPLKVSKIWKDGNKTYVLPSGTEVSDMHPKFKDVINETYRAYPEVPKGVIEALLMKESTAGYNDKNRNPKIGKYAWVGGLTPIAKEELIRLGYKPDFDTIDGAINSMAKFWSLKAKGRSPREVYAQEYSSGKLRKSDLDKFEEMVKAYAKERREELPEEKAVSLRAKYQY